MPEIRLRGGKRWFPRFMIAGGIVVGLFALLVWTYQFSFEHSPKRDQLYYLLETSRSLTLKEILGRSISYNRTRTVEASDIQLFRPGLYLLLALQRYYFDFHFSYYRWVSLIIHGVVCWVFYRLLAGILHGSKVFFGMSEWKRTGLCLAVSLLFAFNVAISEVVSWEHIQGYMVFSGLVLLGLERCMALENRQFRSWRGPVFVIWLAFLFAVFFHEAGVVLCPLVGAYLAVSGRFFGKLARRAPLGLFFLFLLIPALYLSINIWDYGRHVPNLITDNFASDFTAGSTVSETLFNGLRMVVFCCIQPLVPLLIRMETLQSMICVRDVFVPWRDGDVEQCFLLVVLLVLTMSVLALVGWLIGREKTRGRYFPLLVGCMLAGYLSVYVVLRVNVRGDLLRNFLGYNPQYIYFCLPLAICLVFQASLALYAHDGLSRPRWVAPLIVTYLILMVALSIGQTRSVMRSTALFFAHIRNEVWLPGSQALKKVRESGRSRVAFLADPTSPENSHSAFGARLTTHFFGRHEVFEQPEAYILLPSGGVIYPDDTRKMDPMKIGVILPNYVETVPSDVITVRGARGRDEFRSSFVVFRDAQGWFANLAIYPVLESSKSRKFPFCIEGATREEVVIRCRAAAQRARTAALEGRFLMREVSTPYIHEVYRGRILVQILARYLAVPAPGTSRREFRDRVDQAAREGLVAEDLRELKSRIDEVILPR